MAPPDDNSSTSARSEQGATKDTPAYTILGGTKLVVAICSLYCCLFLNALDQYILTTSSPHIVSEFHALDDIAWLTTAYLLGQASFMLIFGKILTLAPVKPVILLAVFLFEAGSAIAGAAPNISVLLFGRTLSGVGAAGIYVGVFAIIAQITTIHSRPRVIGFAGVVFALSSVIGPLAGGGFADSSATWRWCFYLNLPIGATAAAVLFFVIPNIPAPPAPEGVHWVRRIGDVDPIGCLLVIGSTVCFLVPLTTGGNQFHWDSAVVITLFPVSTVLCAILIWWCRFRGARAILPLSLVTNRSMVGACLHGFFAWGAMMIATIYLPYYFQAIKGSSATRSAIQLLPFTVVATSAAAPIGFLISRTGDLWPWLVGPPLLSAVGYGLMYTFGVDTPLSKAYGLQVLAAVGIGSCVQQSFLVPQILYRDSPGAARMGISLVSFTSFIGRTVAISLGSALLLNDLRKQLPRALPNAPPALLAILEQNVDAVRDLPPEYLDGARRAYAHGLRLSLVLGVPFAACATLAGMLVQRLMIVRKEHGDETAVMDKLEPDIREVKSAEAREEQ